MEARQQRLIVALNHIFQAVKRNEVVRRTVAVGNDLNNLLHEARIIGVSPDQIQRLVTIISSDSIGNGIRMIIIKCLLPSQFVPNEAVLTCFGWMNTPSATNKIQALLLRWIAAIYGLIDDVTKLHSVYHFLFFYMKCNVLRKHVVPLLVLLTKKRDVVGYRVDRLMRIRSVIGDDPFLNELLSLYKFYCPHLVPFRLRTYNMKPLASLYQPWVHYVVDIQKKNLETADRISKLCQNSRLFWKVEDNASHLPPVTKTQKYSRNLPGLSDNLGDLSETDKRVLPVHCVASFREMIDVVDRVQLPIQSLIALRYPVLQNLVSCFLNKDFIIRFGYNLNMILNYDFRTDSTVLEIKAHRMFLEKLILFSRYLKESIPTVEKFLVCYFNFCWNGRDFADHILKLITWSRLKHYKDLKDILLPLKKLFYFYDAKCKVAVILSLCELLDNFMYVEFERHLKFNNTSGMFRSETWQQLYLFVAEKEDYSPHETIEYLITFIDDLVTIGIILEKYSTLILHAAAAFFKLVVEFSIEKKFPFYKIPSPGFVYGSLFSLDVTLLSQLLFILSKCRQAVTVIRHRRSEDTNQVVQTLSSKSGGQTHLLNIYIGELMTSLWLNKTFQTTDERSVFFICVEIMQILFSEDTRLLFSAFCHPAILPFTFTFYSTVGALPLIGTPILALSQATSQLHNYFMFLTDAGLRSIPEFITLFGKTRFNPKS